MKSFHVPEWVKNLLIIGLSLSALYLFTLSPLYLNSPLRGWTSRLGPAAEGGQTVSVSFTAAARPTRMAVNSGAGRYGLQYDAAGVSALFSQTGSLLGEALGSAGEAAAVSEGRWRRALTGESLYFDFSGSIPFSALTSWLSGEENPLLTGDVRRLALAPGNDGEEVWLFWQDAWNSALFYASVTNLRVSAHLEPQLTAFAPNGARFAFEDEALAAYYPYTLITDEPGSAAVYAASNPVAAREDPAMKQLLSALSFSGVLVAEYAMGDDAVYRAGENTLTVSRDGSLAYHGTDGSYYPVASEGAQPTLAEMIETTRRLAAGALQPLCGEAELYLLSARQEDGETWITYGYSLNGAPVWTGNEGWAAQFKLVNGALTGFVMHPRSYYATDRATLVLPAVQAAAAMSALEVQDSELLLVYRDVGGETVSAGWYPG